MGTIRYYLGLADHKPKFDRFSYVEKAEYLALVWGSIVMVVTGFILWFQNEALKHLPMWGWTWPRSSTTTRRSWPPWPSSSGISTM